MVALATAVTLLAAWVVWAFKAQVTQYEVSDSARLEVTGAAYPVEANVAGRLVTSRLVLGKKVQAGDILLELESTDQQLSLRQEKNHLASLDAEMMALRSQMHSEESGSVDEQSLLAVSKDGARAQYQQARAQELLAAEEAERAKRLRADGLISEADAQRAAAEAQSRHAAAESLGAAISRLQPELRLRDREREVRVKQLLGDISKLETDAVDARAAIQRLSYDFEKRRILAPIAGTLSECAPVRPGAHISEGEQLGLIVPGRSLQLVAEFAPAAALGKLHPGQSAVVRLQGFPWAEFGTLKAQVSRVGGEIRDGKVRVELTMKPGSELKIPVQHGMPGEVEVVTGRTSPALLLLRSAGQIIGGH
jgi:membrane fusion protein (multidrug efflux system)